MTVAIEDATGVAAPRIRLGGRFRLGERVTAADGLSLWKASLWKATDELLRRPVAVHLLPRGVPVPAPVVEAVQAAVTRSPSRNRPPSRILGAATPVASSMATVMATPCSSPAS